MKRVAVITGGSGGIGKATAELFAQRGFKVYELSRSGKNTDAVTHITADVTDEDQICAAFEQIFAAEKRLDVLVNNAGMGISGAVEFTQLRDAKRIFDLNFFGVFLCAKQAIKYLRQTPGSQIINISSAAAVFSIPYQSFYSATKSAQNSLTLALSSELRAFGIRVNAVMPGDVRTGFTAAREKSDAGAEVYGNAVDSAVAVMEKDETNGMSPEKIAAAVWRVSQKKSTGKLYTAGGKYKLFVFLSRVLPTAFVTRIVAAMYK